MEKTTILIADDHPYMRKGLRYVIERASNLEIVAEAATGREAVRLCSEQKPDIAVIDVAMPELNGLDTAAHIMNMGLKTRVIILSMHADEAYVLRALTVGVSGYLLKDAAEADLLEAIESVKRGTSYFSRKVSATLNEDYVRSLRQLGLRDSYELLTDREREVLQLIAEGKSNKEVANMLDISVATAETHRSNLMQKLNLHSTAEIVLYAMRKKIIS